MNELDPSDTPVSGGGPDDISEADLEDMINDSQGG